MTLRMRTICPYRYIRAYRNKTSNCSNVAKFILTQWHDLTVVRTGNICSGDCETLLDETRTADMYERVCILIYRLVDRPSEDDMTHSLTNRSVAQL
jgi:hypothetical protein